MAADQSGGKLRRTIDRLVFGYLSRQNYVESLKCLCNESQALRGSNCMDMSNRLDDKLHGKNLEEIVVVFCEIENFGLPVAMVEFGHRLRGMSNEYNALIRASPQWSSNQKMFYGKHVQPSHQIVQQKKSLAQNVQCSDSLNPTAAGSMYNFSNTHGISNSSSSRRKSQPVSTNARCQGIWKDAIIPPVVQSAQLRINNPSNSEHQEIPDQFTSTFNPDSEQQSSVSMMSIDESAICALDRYMHCENLDGIAERLAIDLPYDFFDSQPLSPNSIDRAVTITMNDQNEAPNAGFHQEDRAENSQNLYNIPQFENPNEERPVCNFTEHQNLQVADPQTPSTISIDLTQNLPSKLFVSKSSLAKRNIPRKKPLVAESALFKNRVEINCSYLPTSSSSTNGQCKVAEKPAAASEAPQCSKKSAPVAATPPVAVSSSSQPKKENSSLTCWKKLVDDHQEPAKTSDYQPSVAESSGKNESMMRLSNGQLVNESTGDLSSKASEKDLSENERKKRERLLKMRMEREEIQKLKKEQEELEKKQATEMERRRREEEEREEKERRERERKRKEREEKMRKKIAGEGSKMASERKRNVLGNKPKVVAEDVSTKDSARPNDPVEVDFLQHLFGEIPEKKKIATKDVQSARAASKTMSSNSLTKMAGEKSKLDEYRPKKERTLRSEDGSSIATKRMKLTKEHSSNLNLSTTSFDDLFDSFTSTSQGNSVKEEAQSSSSESRLCSTVENRKDSIKKAVASGIDKNRPSLLVGGSHSARVGMVLEKATRLRTKFDHEEKMKVDTKSSARSSQVSSDQTQRKRILDLPMPKMSRVADASPVDLSMLQDAAGEQMNCSRASGVQDDDDSFARGAQPETADSLASGESNKKPYLDIDAINSVLNSLHSLENSRNINQ